MSNLVHFKASHLIPLLSQPMNANLESWFSNGLVFELEKSDSVSFFYQGELMVCGGITEYWSGRGQVWSVFSDKSRWHFVPTYRAIKRWLADMLETKYRRIEMSVACDFKLGKKRAKLLGFELECESARKYLPSGEDCALYSLVRT